MKFSGKKDISAERIRGRAAIDAAFLPRLNEVMGPKFALYQAKAVAAGTGVGDAILFADDTEGFIKKFDKLMFEVSMIEDKRQAAQARVDAATSAAEIDAIISSL